MDGAFRVRCVACVRAGRVSCHPHSPPHTHFSCATACALPVRACRARELPPEQVAQSPSGDWFVKSGVVKGVLPEILEELLAARKR